MRRKTNAIMIAEETVGKFSENILKEKAENKRLLSTGIIKFYLANDANKKAKKNM